MADNGAAYTVCAARLRLHCSGGAPSDGPANAPKHSPPSDDELETGGQMLGVLNTARQKPTRTSLKLPV